MDSITCRIRQPSRAALVVVAGLATALTVLAATAIAAPARTSGGDSPRVTVVTETDSRETSSASWIDLPGASTTMTVPSGKRALVLARFSAESECFETFDTDDNRCLVRILIGGSEALPASGDDFAFDSASSFVDANTKGDRRESHSMDRSRSLGPGTYPVRVQWRVNFSSSQVFTLDDWSLVVERWEQ